MCRFCGQPYSLYDHDRLVCVVTTSSITHPSHENRTTSPHENSRTSPHENRTSPHEDDITHPHEIRTTSPRETMTLLSVPPPELLRGSEQPVGRSEDGSPVKSRSAFSVEVKSEDFKFGCGHFVAFQNFRERLHGHNYTVGGVIEQRGRRCRPGRLDQSGPVCVYNFFTEDEHLEAARNRSPSSRPTVLGGSV